MRKLLSVCLLATILSSCSTEPQTLEVPPSRSEMLRGTNKGTAAEETTKWKTTDYKITYKNELDVDTTVTDWYPECKKDDFIQFFTNRKGKHHTGDDLCAGIDGEVYNHTWELTQNEEVINFYNAERYFGERTLIAQISEFSDSKFIMKYEMEYIINNVLDTVRVEHTMVKY